MKIISTNVFVGPNVWASFPVIRHVIDLGILEEWPSAKIGSEFIDALTKRFLPCGAWLFLPRTRRFHPPSA